MFIVQEKSNHRINCCIFGNLADILTKAVKQPNYGDICLIIYAKINNYKGELQVSNAFDTSLVLINPDIKEAKSLKQMYADILGGNCRVICTVYAIDTSSGWYYLDCMIEDQEVLPPEIVEIYGKTYGFGISDDENNMIGGAEKFNAMKVWNLNDIMWKRIKSLHQMLTYSRKKQCINDEGNKNKSNLQISNGYDSSQLVFNPNIKEAEELREAYKFHDDSMSIVETSEEGKYIVSQANNGTGQKLTGWEAVEVKTIYEILNCT
ncbi:hypothetical protein HID58_056149 [Brassica napus]|uniref:Uncharacterized protein n=1 Tax=Brassica napus TaxID=3708 RepID=A0ABQ8AMJ4_BRANA|nr:hypothetical protein HID58_056149 [Brassica napus]